MKELKGFLWNTMLYKYKIRLTNSKIRTLFSLLNEQEEQELKPKKDWYGFLIEQEGVRPAIMKRRGPQKLPLFAEATKDKVEKFLGIHPISCVC